jgi:GNAT superfamily N-acetyltransferase
VISLEINYRFGTSEDLPQIQEICQDVWDGHDYLPSAWTEFVNDPTQLLFVAEINRQIAGIHCVNVQPKAVWWHAVRVAPSFRRQGLAAKMLEHAINEAKARNLAVFRFATGEDNSTMHRIADRFHFKHVSTYTCLQGKKLANFNPSALVRPLTSIELNSVWEFSLQTPSWDGLYCDMWIWKDLTKEVIKAEIENNNLLGCFEGGKLTALALYKLHNDEQGSWLMPGWFGGTKQGISQLANYFRNLITPLNPTNEDYGIVVMASPDENVQKGLLAAGYEPDLTEVLRLYQRSLEGY